MRSFPNKEVFFHCSTLWENSENFSAIAYGNSIKYHCYRRCCKSFRKELMSDLRKWHFVLAYGEMRGIKVNQLVSCKKKHFENFVNLLAFYWRF